MSNRHLGWVLLAGLTAFTPAVGHADDYLADAKRLLQKGDVRAGQIQLRNAVKADPQNAEAHFQLARVSLELGDAIAAEREAKAARDRGYDPRLVIPVLARAYMAQGKFQDVLNEFTVQGKDPAQDADILVIRGYAQAALRNLDDAKASFEQARKLAPTAITPLLAAARLAAGRNNLDEAIADLDSALAVDPHSTEVLVLKGQVLRQKGDAAGAMQAAEQAVHESPDGFAGRLLRAQLLLSAGKTDKAKEDVDFVLASAPGNFQALYLQAILQIQAKDFASADATLAKLVPVVGNIPRVYFLQAIVKQNLKQSEQAEDAASRYVVRVPDDLQGVKLLASLQLRKGEADRAVETLTRATQAGHADAQIYEMLAQADTQAGKRDDAVQSLEKAAALSPDSVAMRTRLAAAKLGAGETDSALGDLEKSLAMAPDQPSVGAALFFADLATGDPSRAAASLDKIRAAQGETPVVRNLEGLLKIAELKPGEARAIFQGILKDNPDFVPASTNLARVAIMEGRRDDARSILAGILAKNPASEPALSIYEAELLRDGKAADAIAATERARATAPTDLRLTIALADLYARNGESAKAIALLTPADAATNPPALQIIAARAQIQTAQGMADAARDSYRELLVRQPASVETRLRLVAYDIDHKEYEDARNLVQEGLRLAPRDYQLLSALTAIDLKATGLDAALATADRLQKQNQDFVPARALAGDLYMGQKQFDAAAKSYAAAQAATPSTFLLMRLTGALSNGGHADKAADALRDWTVKHPDDVAVAEALSGMQISQNKLDEAQSTLEKVIQQRPRDPIALNNLAWVYQQKGDPRAEALAQRAYILLPGPQTADTLGWILVNKGDAPTGLMLLRQATAQGSTDPNITYHLAVALNKAGQRDEAVKVLKPLVSGDKNFADKVDAQRLFSELSKG